MLFKSLPSVLAAYLRNKLYIIVMTFMALQYGTWHIVLSIEDTVWRKGFRRIWDTHVRTHCCVVGSVYWSSASEVMNRFVDVVLCFFCS